MTIVNDDEPDWERLDQLSRRAFDRAADALRCHEIASPGSMPAKTWEQTPDHVKDRWRMAASVALNAAGVVGLHEVLTLILPLAKGYAHANPHDVNNRVIEAAEEALRRHEAPAQSPATGTADNGPTVRQTEPPIP